MTYVNRLRRHWRVTTRRIDRAGRITTARQFLELQGTGTDFAAKFAGQITKAAKKFGFTASAHTWTVRNGHARRTAAYDLSTQALGLLLAWVGYKRTAALSGLTVAPAGA